MTIMGCLSLSTINIIHYSNVVVQYKRLKVPNMTNFSLHKLLNQNPLEVPNVSH